MTLSVSKKLTNWLAVLLVTLIITGCGFKLRGSHFIPKPMQNMVFSSKLKTAKLADAVQKHLQHNGVTFHRLNEPDVSKSEVAYLQLINDKLDRRTLSLFANGQVAEYELIYSVTYQVTAPNQDPQTFEFEIYRNYQDDPDNVLAKSRELELVVNEMRQQAADRILRQLATIK